MKYIIFIILIIIIGIMYFYYERKLSITKKQLMITSKQFKNIKSEYKNTLYKNQNINVKFLIPDSQTAITSTNGNVFLAPLTTSPKINSFNIKMEVKILDSAIINNDLWYYVSLPVESDYNCRGWINKNDFSVIYSSIKDLTTYSN